MWYIKCLLIINSLTGDCVFIKMTFCRLKHILATLSIPIPCLLEDFKIHKNSILFFSQHLALHYFFSHGKENECAMILGRLL